MYYWFNLKLLQAVEGLAVASLLHVWLTSSMFFIHQLPEIKFVYIAMCTCDLGRMFVYIVY